MGALVRLSLIVASAVLWVPAVAVGAADCAGEEIRACESCSDGIDNDGDGRIDAEDSGCATLSEYQRVAILQTKPFESRLSGAAPAVSGVLLPGALLGDAVDGRCAVAEGTCICPAAAPECQALGRPCSVHGDCSAVPFPLGRSRAGICDAGEDTGNEEICPQDDLILKATAIARIPGRAIDPLAAGEGDAPLIAAFEGGRHVVDVAFVRLGREAQLVLAGEADTTLVIRVHGDLELGEGSAVTLAGELEADRVLWVTVGSDGVVAIGPAARFVGTIFAPERDAVELGGGVRIYGAILGGEVRQLPEARPPYEL